MLSLWNKNLANPHYIIIMALPKDVDWRKGNPLMCTDNVYVRAFKLQSNNSYRIISKKESKFMNNNIKEFSLITGT